MKLKVLVSSTEEGSSNEHFVHVTGLIDEIREGDEVEFELQEGRKGMNAVKCESNLITCFLNVMKARLL